MRVDSLGLFWQDLATVTAGERERIRPPIPDTGWARPRDLPRLDAAKVIGVDTETYDPNLETLGPGFVRPGVDTPHDGYIVGVSIATDDRSWYFPVRHPDSDNFDEERLFAWLRKELARERQPKVGAHIGYDIGWLRVNDVLIRGPLYDVQYAEPLLDENAVTYELDYLAHKYLKTGKNSDVLYAWCADAFGGAANSKQRANIWRTPATLVGPYAEADASIPITIIRQQIRQLKAEKLYELFSLESSLIPLLSDMHFEGVRVDMQRAEGVQSELLLELDEATDALEQAAGFPVNVNASQSIADAFDNAGLKYPKTREGRPSFKKDFLTSHRHPLAQAVNTVRKIAKAKGTFVDSYIFKHQINGRIHATFHPLRTDANGTVSGRFAASNPNLQNVPKRDVYLAPLIRSIFVPNEGAQQWRKFDYCLTGDTLIQTTAGNTRIDALTTHHKVLSVRADTNILEYKTVLKHAKVGVLTTFEITLDDGSTVSATADHKWLLRSKHGSREMVWCQTRDLVPGTRLAHVFENYAIGGRCQLSFRGAQYMRASIVCEATHGPAPLGCTVDHIDANATNDIATNLRWLDAALNKAQGGQRYWEKVRAGIRDDTLRQTELRAGIARRRSYIGEGNPNYGMKRPGVGGHPTHKNNHRVVSVKKIERSTVYQLTVEDNHNYVLANGLVSANSQIEYRLLAHFGSGGGAEEVRDVYRNDPNIDFHQMVTDMIDSIAHILLDRSLTKNVSFGLVYGMAENTLRNYIGVTKKEAQRIFAAYHEGAPFIKHTYDATMREAAAMHEVRTLLGRKRRFVEFESAVDGVYGVPMTKEAAIRAYGFVKPAHTHKALNGRLQGSAADIIKQAMVDAYTDGVFDVIGVPHVQVHDELGFSDYGSREEAEAFVHLKHIMEHCLTLRVPILVDESHGPTWGACK